MKILLTGATGYIGRRLLSVLLERGHTVVCAVRDSGRLDLKKYKPDQVTLVETDLLQADLVVLATGYKGIDHQVGTLFGADVAERVGRVWGFDDHTQELRNMWSKTGQPGLWFTGGAFSQCRIYSRYIALQIDAIETGRLPK